MRRGPASRVDAVAQPSGQPSGRAPGRLTLSSKTVSSRSTGSRNQGQRLGLGAVGVLFEIESLFSSTCPL